ncbi:hypothetical protein JTB14_018614 [Gonioctena quinquepunctata]|nr:hypothetical protein JTB14_018614 [Gonioctena quinquepunctata]
MIEFRFKKKKKLESIAVIEAIRKRLKSIDILDPSKADNKISNETQGVNEVNVDIKIFGELSEDDSDYESYDVNMVRPRFNSKKERKLGCSNTEMKEKKEVETMNQNGILESRQIGEKSETEGRFQEKERNQLKKRKSWEIHNTK